MPARIPTQSLTSALVIVALLLTTRDSPAIGQVQYVESAASAGSFTLAQPGAAANLYVDANDWPGVARAAQDLSRDVARVTGITPTIAHNEQTPGANVAIIGTIGKSALIDRLIREKKFDPTPLTGKWEASLIQVVKQPLPGVESALVIVGSNKRGTI